MRHTYFSIAETMPHNLELADEVAGVSSGDLVAAILDSACVNPIEQATRSGPESWPKRHLPPGRLADLYLMYVGWARSHGRTSACAETFRQVWRLGWDKTLLFRKSSTHSLCFTCGRLKAKIRNAEQLDEHISACSALVTHLRDQWRDRAIYWGLRARARTEKDILCVIGDGMDKSKFGIPQWEGGRAPKHAVVDHNNRPSCSVYACVAHGYRVDVYITHEGMPTGAAFCCDMLLRTLDRVWKQCQKTGRPFPLDLAIQGDNTTKELKNSILARTIAMLASAGLFRACGHFHLRVGHTHEDVDQFFGLVARIL